MTIEQVEHLKSIQRRLNSRLEEKYVKGQLEHGGNLWERDNLKDLGMEIVDMLTYFHCVEDNILKIKKLTDLMYEGVREVIVAKNTQNEPRLDSAIEILCSSLADITNLLPKTDYDKRTTCCVGLHAPDSHASSDKTNSST